MFTQVLMKELAHMLTLVLKIFSYRVSFKMLFSMYLALVEKELWTYLWLSKFHICTFKNKNHNNDGSRAHRSILFYQCFWTKKKKKWIHYTEFQGIFISFKSQVYSRQGRSIFLLFFLFYFPHGFYHYISMFG